MRTALVVVWTVATVGACVNLDKPVTVSACAANDICLNKPSNSDARPNDIVAAGPDGSDATGRDAASEPPGATPDGSDATFDTPDATATPDAAPDQPSATPDATPDQPADAIVGACTIAGQPAPAGTVCRAAADLCDVAEVCDGVTTVCPADGFATAGTVCRVSAGDCDIVETCTGKSTACPSDAFESAGTVCRKVAGLCDVAESCTGSSATCPVDSLAPATTVCRASADGNQCDPAETCTGSSAACPTDVAYSRPPTPTGVAAAPGSLQATVSWNAATGATGYNVKRSATSGSGYTTLGSTPTAAASPYLDVGLTSGATYFYVVSSVNTVATCESANSTVVSAIPTGPTCTPPPAPTVTAIASNGQVTLSWTASTGATSYAIARSITSGTGYATIQVASVGTTFSDLNVVNGTTYYYVISASNGTCSSGNSVEVSAAPTCTPPAAPTGIVATPNNGAVALAWTAPTGAVSYRVLRSTTSGSGYLLVGNSSTPAFTDTTVANGTTYYYVITASNGSCNSVNSIEVPAAPLCVPPSVPTNVTATPDNKQVVLAWTASTGGAALYRVSRGTAAAGPFTSIATPAGIGYTDVGVTNGTTYYYVVSASNGSCSSADTVAIPATPVCTPPPVPGTLVATPGDTQVALTWVASTPAPTSYSVGRSTVSGGPYTSVATPTVTAYTDIDLTDGTTYYFVVSASNGTCSSANSAEKSATPAFICPQAAPTGLVATAGNQQVLLTWTAAAGATSYGIARSTTSGTGYVSVGAVTAPTTAFVDSDAALVNGTTYYYVVSAGSTCTSVNSSEASAKPVCTPPPPPAGVVATNNDANGRITVTWNTSAGATAYTVSRNTAATGTFTPISTNQTAATFTEPVALTPGNTYFYTVSASNASGTCASDNSTPAASAMSCTIPMAPIGLAATIGTSGQVSLTWTASTGATAYNILRSTSSGGTYTSAGTSPTASFVDTGRTNDTTYFYEVAAQTGTDGNCSSPNSSPPLAATPRACQVFGSGVGQYTFNTTGPVCFVTCNGLQFGWGCDSFPAADTTRTVTVNGQPVTCGGTLPAASNGAFTFNISGTGHTWDALHWSGVASTCP